MFYSFDSQTFPEGFESVGYQVKRSEVKIKYFDSNGIPDERVFRLFEPQTQEKRRPMILYAHYDMKEEAEVIKLFLKKGWTFGMPSTNSKCHEKLSSDDILYHCAVVSFAQDYEAIDSNRIAIYGGSAGGYMTLMTIVINAGICGFISESGIANYYFNSRCFMKKVNEMNLRVYDTLSDEVKKDNEKLMASLPMPIHYVLTNRLFKWNVSDLDVDLAMASAVSYPGCFVAPGLMIHYTADNLVPIEQITKRFSHASDRKHLDFDGDFRQEAGEEQPNFFPKGIFDGLDSKEDNSLWPGEVPTSISSYSLPAGVSHSLDEILPSDQIAYSCEQAPRDGDSRTLEIPFSKNKMFNFAIFDDGAPLKRPGHSRNPRNGRHELIPYLEYLFNRTANYFTPDKIIFMAERYCGQNKLVPAFDSDQDIAGSVRETQRTVLNQFRLSLPVITDEMWQSAQQKRPDLSMVIREIRSKIC